MNRLLDASIPGVYAQSWTYNPIGNILSRTDGSTATYSYNDPAHKHAVTQIGSLYYCYDANGNMTKRGAANSACSSGGDTLTYDVENRMTSMVTASSTTNFTYNGDGRMTSRLFRRCSIRDMAA